MKIIFVLPNLGAGGAERVVTVLSHEFTVCGLKTDILLMMDDTIQYTIPESVQLVRLNTLSMSRRQRIKVMRNYFKQEKKEHDRVVIIPFQESCLNYSLAAAVGLGIPVFACERNDPYQKGSHFVQRIKANLPFALASHCIFQTPEAGEYYWHIVQKKGTVIPNPLCFDAVLDWNGERDQRIVSVGRLQPQKNQKLLIESFAEVHEKFPEYKLEIYGEGRLKDELSGQIRSLGLEDAVFLRGYSKNVLEKIVSAKMFVLSSDYEGMSNALLEAMAIGLPVVSTDHPIGGARYVIKNRENGILIPVNDKQAMVNAMIELINDSLLADTISHNAVLLRKRLSADVIASEWIKIIDSL